jgi:uncharacterized protein YndB with AHSA1/START domain
VLSWLSKLIRNPQEKESRTHQGPFERMKPEDFAARRVIGDTEAEIALSHPIEDVWQIIIDVRTHTSWLDPMSETEYVLEAGGQIGRGTWLNRTYLPTKQIIRGQILEFKPPQLLVIEAKTDLGAVMRVEYHLEPVPAGCKLRAVWKYDSGHSFGLPVKEDDSPDFFAEGMVAAEGPPIIPATAAKQYWEECLERLRFFCDETLAKPG